MSTRAVASAVFPLPIDEVWAALREFDFPRTLIGPVSAVTILDGKGADSVGAVREVEWSTGEKQQHRLLELSDQHYRAAWELIFADPPAEQSGRINTLALYRVTETNETLVEWSGDFSADVSADAIQFERRAYLENLVEVRTNLVQRKQQ